MLGLLYVGPLLEGLATTVELFAAAVAASTALGLVFAVLRDINHPVLSRLVQLYSGVLRGLPPLLVLLIVFLGFPTFGLTLSPFMTALVGITTYGLAYMGEIIYAGLKSAGAEMRDGVRALGIPYRIALVRIYLPHASGTAAPAFFTETTELLKDTALAGAVGVTELASQAQSGASFLLKPLPIFGEAALGYAVIGSLLLIMQEWSARRAGNRRGQTLAGRMHQLVRGLFGLREPAAARLPFTMRAGKRP